jgi:hypothetical protein
MWCDSRQSLSYRSRIILCHFSVAYLGIVFCGAGAAATGGLADVCLLLGTGWFALTLRFIVKRLRGTSRAPGHLLEMLVTSLAIPWLAVQYRVVGWTQVYRA